MMEIAQCADYYDKGTPMVTETYQTIRKAAAILDALGNEESDAMRAADIERIVNFGASTTVRLLASLESYGLVCKTDSQHYALGPAILRLSSQKLNHSEIFRESRVLCHTLAQQTGLNAYVATKDGGRIVFICNCEGKLSPKNRTIIGMPVSLHASAMGKCMLLDTTEDERRNMLTEPFNAFTSKTVTTHEQLTHQLEASRIRGYCLEEEEVSFGRISLSAPIRNARSHICAAVSVAGRMSAIKQMGLENIAEQVLETADRISVNLGMIGDS